MGKEDLAGASAQKNGMLAAYASEDTLGLTKREAFALGALQGLLATGMLSREDTAYEAVGMADALLLALTRKDPTDAT